MNNNLKSFFFTITAVLFWSTAATAFKLTLNGMNNIQLLFYSCLTSFIVLLILLLIKSPNQIKVIYSKEHIRNNLLLGITNPFLYYLVLFKAYNLLSAQEAMLLNYTWPLIISLFSVLFLKAKISSRIFIGLIIAFMGVVIIGTGGSILSLEFNNFYGVVLAVSSSFIWATYWTINLLDKRTVLIKLTSAFLYSLILITVYIFLFDSILLFDYTYLIGSIYIGLFEMSITFLLWLKGISLSKNKAKMATLVYLSPFISIIFIAIILEETIKISSLVGLVFIISGILIQHIFLIRGKLKFKLE